MTQDLYKAFLFLNVSLAMSFYFHKKDFWWVKENQDVMTFMNKEGVDYF